MYSGFLFVQLKYKILCYKNVIFQIDDLFFVPHDHEISQALCFTHSLGAIGHN